MKPCGDGWHSVSATPSPQSCPGPRNPQATQDLTKKAWLALSLRAVSSGLSTGVCRVKWVSNWLTSSSDCCGQTRAARRDQAASEMGPPAAPGPAGPPLTRDGLIGGSTRQARRSSQLICRKKGCLCGYRAPKHPVISTSLAHRETPCTLRPCLPPGAFGGSALPPPGAPRPTCTSAASPGPPPIRWLGFRFRNCRARAEGEALGERTDCVFLQVPRGGLGEER